MLQHLRSLVPTRWLPGPRHDQDGASAVEYGMLVAGIAGLIVVVVMSLGGVIEHSFNKTCGTLSAGNTGTAPSATCR